MVKKWKGIKEIVEKATKELIETKEDGYLFYSAPEGQKLILLVDIKDLPAWRKEIKDFGIPINGEKNRIFCRGFSDEDEGIVTEGYNPLLELVEEERMGADEIKKRIKEEWKESRLRVQGRKFPRTFEEET
ncbi:MAG: hypothetical protein JSW00_13560 [Thermoplasmata archaeon]|nr:MAG: hypothetical protein JSW00_13560 [Thermoplasmata archaeon]